MAYATDENLPTRLLPPELGGPEPLSAADVEALVTFAANDPDAGPVALPSEEARRWRIEDDGAAEWAMRRLAMAEEDLARIAAQADEWRKPIDEWQDHQARRPNSAAAFFRAHLEGYALRVQDASGGDIKTVALPSGKVGTRENPARMAVDDPTVLLEWAKEHAPQAVAERVPLTALKEVAAVAEVVTLAKVTLSPCGCIVAWSRSNGPKFRALAPVSLSDAVRGPWLPGLPGLADGVECPECASEALTGRIDVEATVNEPLTAEGVRVPGVYVEPATVTATAKPRK